MDEDVLIGEASRTERKRSLVDQCADRYDLTYFQILHLRLLPNQRDINNSKGLGVCNLSADCSAIALSYIMI